jgi:tRNA uridine 5-carbamoylmethylation protein Kti12
MNKKLILFEGIPGSGKSTFARFITVQLERNGYTPILYLETTADHPIFIRNTIDDTNAWMEAYLNNWNNFLTSENYEGSIIVMESALIQNPILNLLNKDIERDRIKSFIIDLSSMLREHDTSLIFLYQEDSLTAIDNMIKSRGGAQFLMQKYEEFKEEKYYINRNREGPELHLGFLKEYDDISKVIIDQMKINVLSIENSKKEWQSYEKKLLGQYNLKFTPDPIISQTELQKFIGVFRNNVMNFNVNIELIEGYLYIFGNRKLKIRRKNIFYLDDMSVEIKYIEENGEYKQLIIGEKDIFANRSEDGTAFDRIS